MIEHRENDSDERVIPPTEQLMTAVKTGTFLHALHQLLDGADIGKDEHAVAVIAGDIVDNLEMDGRRYSSQYKIPRPDLLQELTTLFAAEQKTGQPEGPSLTDLAVIGVLIITLCGLENSERLRRYDADRTTDSTKSHRSTCSNCEMVLGNDRVWGLLLAMYRGGGSQLPEVLPAPTQDYPAGSIDSNPFHRHGTTSVILKVQKASDPSNVLALKLVLRPFLKIREISEATRNYADTYATDPGPRAQGDGQLMRIDSSGTGWILSSFHFGVTLADMLAERRAGCHWQENPMAPLRLRDDIPPEADESERNDSIRRRADNQLFIDDTLNLAPLVVTALRAYHEVAATRRNSPAAHGDLTPSNIILTADSRLDRSGTANRWKNAVLIDYGVNHLYSYLTSTGLEPDAVYLAPEIVTDRPESPKEPSDYFSLGQIVIELLGIAPNRDGSVPDVIYAWHPGIARLLEGLLDPDPVLRARWPEASRGADLDDIEIRIEFELAVAKGAREAPDFAKHSSSRFFFFFWPFSGELGRQKRLKDTVRNWPSASDGDNPVDHKLDDHEEVYKSLRTSAVADSYRWSRRWAILLWIVFSVVAVYISAETRVPLPGNLVVQIAAMDTRLGSLADALSLPAYHVPNWQHNWPARIVALSYVLLATKLYFNIYARISPSGGEDVPLTRWARGAKAWMRLLPPVNSILVLSATVLSADLWPLATAIGQVVTAFGNLAIVGYLHRSFQLADNRYRMRTGSLRRRRSSSVAGYGLISSWVNSSFVYALVCCGVCIGIYTGLLVDVWLYASIVAFVNIFLLFVVKCGLDGPRIRIALTKADVLAERGRLVEQTNRNQP